MSLLRRLSDGLRSLFRKERVRQELDEELGGFLEMAAEESMKKGMSREGRSPRIHRQLRRLATTVRIATKVN